MSGSNSPPTPVQAMSASAFIGSIGVCTHLDAFSQPYGNTSWILPDMNYLGLSNIYDTTPQFASLLTEFESLAAAGIKFDLNTPDITQPASFYISYMDQLEQADPGSIVGVTTLNEVAPSNTAAAEVFQNAIYNAVHSDPLLNGVPVALFSLGSMLPSVFSSYGTIPGADQGNAHVYSNALPPIYMDAWYATPAQTGLEAGKPWIVTETGYQIAPIIQNGFDIGVNADVAAKYELDNIFDLIKLGASKVYIFELLDSGYDPNYTIGYEDYLGLFDSFNNPTEGATAIHNLTTILADPGSNASNFSAGTLSYSITGINSYINSAVIGADFGYGILNGVVDNLPVYTNDLLLEKSNGSYDLVVWAEPEIWNQTTNTEIPAPAETIVVTLAQAAASVEIYDPLVGTLPIASAVNATTITFQVTDHPLIIEIDPYPQTTTTAASTPASTGSNYSSNGTSPASTGSIFTTVNTTTIGSGSDTIALSVSQDYYNGNAQFYVSVDGAQIGGLQTVSALAQAGLGSAETVNVEGNFGSGSHQVTVTFTNDAYGGTPTADRNLYVLDASYDGVLAPSSELVFLPNGSQSITLGNGVPGPTVVGSGSDTIALNVSEDEYLGNAQFTVSVDGQQIGGVLTASAIRTAGESQIFDIEGNFGNGQHAVSINLLNGASYNYAELADRAIYINSAIIDGSTIGDGTLGQDDVTGTESFIATKVTSGIIPPAVTYLGSGPDSVAFFVSGDYYLGNAEFVLSVDGKQVGGTQYTTAAHASGQGQEFDVLGNFGPGQHTASIQFLNDAAATPYNVNLDRNVYVNAATINGNTISNSTLVLLSNSTQSFSFITPGTPAATYIGQGPDNLALTVSEDYYQANAEFTVAVDGTQIGGIQTATAINNTGSSLVFNPNGQSQLFNVLGSFGGTHTVALTFLNDAAATPYQQNLDRNLYIGGASIDGTKIANTSLALLANGTQTFTFTH